MTVMIEQKSETIPHSTDSMEDFKVYRIVSLDNLSNGSTWKRVDLGDLLVRIPANSLDERYRDGSLLNATKGYLLKLEQDGLTRFPFRVVRDYTAKHIYLVVDSDPKPA